jgi:heme/copper-type cytochrome/quinol oxidase subunit 1
LRLPTASQAPLVVQPHIPADGVQATAPAQPGELKNAMHPLVQTSAFQMPSENKIGFIALIVGVSAIVLKMLFWCEAKEMLFLVWMPLDLKASTFWRDTSVGVEISD